MKYLILGAMPKEVAAYKLLAEEITTQTSDSQKDIQRDKQKETPEIIVETIGVSKPIAATTTQTLIDKHKPDTIIFSGVAGALDEKLKIGDIGICAGAIDSDLDVRTWNPEYKRGEVPFTRDRVYTSDPDLVKLALLFKTVPYPDEQTQSRVRIFNAYIATGSKFLDKKGKREFKEDLHELEAVIDNLFACFQRRTPNLYDMESSAVLQTANANNTPCLIIRAVSDTANGNAPKEFNDFIKKSVGVYVDLIKYIVNNFK